MKVRKEEAVERRCVAAPAVDTDAVVRLS